MSKPADSIWCLIDESRRTADAYRQRSASLNERAEKMEESHCMIDDGGQTYTEVKDEAEFWETLSSIYQYYDEELSKILNMIKGDKHE